MGILCKNCNKNNKTEDDFYHYSDGRRMTPCKECRVIINSDRKKKNKSNEQDGFFVFGEEGEFYKFQSRW